MDINLKSQLLSALPAEIPRLTALQELDLSLNQLNCLPDRFGQLTALREDFDLSYNRIGGGVNPYFKLIPSYLGHLTAMTKALSPLLQKIGRPHVRATASDASSSSSSWTYWTRAQRSP